MLLCSEVSDWSSQPYSRNIETSPSPLVRYITHRPDLPTPAVVVVAVVAAAAAVTAAAAAAAASSSRIVAEQMEM